MRASLPSCLRMLLAVALAYACSVEADGRPLAEFPMTPEVRQQWTSLLGSSGLDIAIEDIDLPTKPVSNRTFPFRVYDFSFVAGDRDGRLTVHAQTGEPVMWLVFGDFTAPEHPERGPEEVRARIEAIAVALLPPATARFLMNGPDYFQNSGTWMMHWEAMRPGDRMSPDGYTIRVFDSDLSLASYSGGGCFTPKIEDMTVVIDATAAKKIAMDALSTIYKTVHKAGEAPVPENLGEPYLVPAAYHPRFMETGRMERYDARRERRLAWKVTALMRSDRGNGDQLVSEWYLHVDAKTGEVIGGDRRGIVLGPDDLANKDSQALGEIFAGSDITGR